MPKKYKKKPTPKKPKNYRGQLEKYVYQPRNRYIKKIKRKPVTFRKPMRLRKPMTFRKPVSFRKPVTFRKPVRLRKQPLQIRRKPISMKSMNFQDSKFYSSQTGKKPVFKRRTRGFKNMDGDISGFEFDQDNNQKRLITYPN